MKPSVIILAFNSADSLPATLASLAGLSDDVVVVDSGSTDETVALAEQAGATVLHHPFKNYGDQRNWAIDNAPIRYAWQLHLDADERLMPELRQAQLGQLGRRGGPALVVVDVQRDFDLGADAPRRPAGAFLRAVSQRAYDEDIFSHVLTPFFNAAHRNHFHVDLARYRGDGTRPET